MAVVSMTIVQVKPDRWEEFLDQTRKTKPIMEQAGARTSGCWPDWWQDNRRGLWCSSRRRTTSLPPVR